MKLTSFLNIEASYHNTGSDKDMHLVSDHHASSDVPQSGDSSDNGIAPLVQTQTDAQV